MIRDYGFSISPRVHPPGKPVWSGTLARIENRLRLMPFSEKPTRELPGGSSGSLFQAGIAVEVARERVQLVFEAFTETRSVL